jgi:hypothetical protein
MRCRDRNGRFAQIPVGGEKNARPLFAYGKKRDGSLLDEQTQRQRKKSTAIH